MEESEVVTSKPEEVVEPEEPVAGAGGQADGLPEESRKNRERNRAPRWPCGTPVEPAEPVEPTGLLRPRKPAEKKMDRAPEPGPVVWWTEEGYDRRPDQLETSTPLPTIPAAKPVAPASTNQRAS